MNTLEQKIIEYQKQGWVLLSHTGSAAQLRKPKGSPGCLTLIILLLLGVLPGILYLILCALEKDRIVMLFADEQGAIQETGDLKGKSNAPVAVLIILIVIATIVCLIASNQGGASSAVLSLI